MSYPGYSSIFNPRNNVHARTVHFYWEKLLTFFFTSRNCSLSRVCSDLTNQILTDGFEPACDGGSRKDY